MLLGICGFSSFPCVSFLAKESAGVPLLGGGGLGSRGGGGGGGAPVSSFYACSSFPLVLAHRALPTAFHPRYSEKCVEPCQLVCFRCCGESAGCIV